MQSVWNFVPESFGTFENKLWLYIFDVGKSVHHHTIQLEYGQEPLRPVKLGNLLSIWATVPLRKIRTYKKAETWDFAFVVYSLFRRQHEKIQQRSLNSNKQCFGCIRQQTSRCLWKIFFVAVVTPFTVVKGKDCHKRWAYVRPSQTPRRGWRLPDFQNAKISCRVFRTGFLSSDRWQYSGSLLWDPRESD